MDRTVQKSIVGGIEFSLPSKIVQGEVTNGVTLNVMRYDSSRSLICLQDLGKACSKTRDGSSTFGFDCCGEGRFACLRVSKDERSNCKAGWFGLIHTRKITQCTDSVHLSTEFYQVLQDGNLVGESDWRRTMFVPCIRITLGMLEEVADDFFALPTAVKGIIIVKGRVTCPKILVLTSYLDFIGSVGLFGVFFHNF